MSEALVVEGANFGKLSLWRRLRAWSLVPLGAALGLGAGSVLGLGGDHLPWQPDWEGAFVLAGAAFGAALGFGLGFTRFQVLERSAFRVTIDDEGLSFGHSQAETLFRIRWDEARAYRIDRRGWVRLVVGQAHSAFLDLRIPCPDDAATAATAGRLDERGLPRL